MSYQTRTFLWGCVVNQVVREYDPFKSAQQMKFTKVSQLWQRHFCKSLFNFLTDNTPLTLELRQSWLPAVSRLPVHWIGAPNVGYWCRRLGLVTHRLDTLGGKQSKCGGFFAAFMNPFIKVKSSVLGGPAIVSCY